MAWLSLAHSHFGLLHDSNIFLLMNFRKRRYHSRRIHRDVIKKRTLIGDDVGLTPPYKHRHSGNLLVTNGTHSTLYLQIDFEDFCCCETP